jgi:cytochrome c
MKLRQFSILLIRPRRGWPQGARGQCSDRGRPLLALSGITYMLLSASYGGESVHEGADAASGQQVFNNVCRTCHTTKEGDNRLGPHLYRIVGRKAGSLPDYGYSSAMKDAGFVWDKQKLERFIANPEELVPGNSMKPYAGLASADDRARIVFFLQSVTASP